MIAYLHTAWRSVFRQGRHNLIIVLGLSIGATIALMVAQYAQFEYSFDRNIPDRDRIQYAYMRWDHGVNVVDGGCFPGVSPFLKRTFPQVESAVRMASASLAGEPKITLRREMDGKIEFYSEVENAFFVDPGFLDFFGVKLLAGDLKTALAAPGSMVISQSVAEKYFPGEDAINQTLVVHYGDFARVEWIVKGVAEDALLNSSVPFNVLVSMNELKKFWVDLDDSWITDYFKTFVKFYDIPDMTAFARMVNDAAVPVRDVEKQGNVQIQIQFLPFEGYHFMRHVNSLTTQTVQFTGDRSTIRYMIAVSIFILLISWVNYINLTTANAMHRAKEIGIRKVSGAGRRQLILQFMTEFLIVNVVSMLVAITLTQLCFPVFVQVLGSHAQWVFWSSPVFWVAIVFFLLTSTILAGLYPSMVLSGYQPVKVLKGRFSRSQSGLSVRRSMVVFQFGLSVLMLMGVYAIVLQWRFLRTQERGLSSQHVMVIDTNELSAELRRADALEQWRNAVAALPEVASVCGAALYPGERVARTQGFFLPTDTKTTVNLLNTPISAGYVQTTGMEILHGRDLVQSDWLTGENVLINESACRALGIDDASAAIGQEIVYGENGEKYRIAGVVRDFVIDAKQSLAGELMSTWNLYDHTIYYDCFLVKVQGENMHSSVATIERKWKELFSGAPFKFFFLDAYFESFYREEGRFASVFGFLCGVGLVIACMGLFGLSVFDTSIRMKEVGIRKTMGASVLQILWLFSRDYLKLVIVACLVGIPLGLVVLYRWLESYPLKIAIGFDLLLLPAVVLAVVSLATIAYHTWQTARSNPVESLRSD